MPIAMLFIIVLLLGLLVAALVTLRTGARWYRSIRESGRTFQISLVELIAFVILLTPILAAIGMLRDEWKPFLILLAICAAIGMMLGALRARVGINEPRPPAVRAIGGMFLGGVAFLVLSFPITCAVGLPNLMASRTVANETKAIGALMAYGSAQAIYRRRKGAFATSAAPLGSMRLIDFAGAFQGGPGKALPYSGYFFLVVTQGPDGPLDPKTQYAVCSYPATYDKSGVLSFYTDQDGSIWQIDNGGKPFTKVPANPAAEGWTRIGS